MGWYIWELMGSQGHWGRVHGVVYPDGTVRDPAIAAAVLGFFRNRGPSAIPAVVDQEKRVTRAITEARQWLERTDARLSDGFSLAETLANFLEAGELVPMKDLPSRKVEELRQGPPNVAPLKVIMRKWIDVLDPELRR
jgi:hypothetical protein